jgi:hypothetical protein
MTRFLAPALCAAFLAAPAMAQDVQFDLFNQSALTLMEFYASPASSGDWGADILGADVVPPGGSGTVLIGDGSSECVYDILSVMEDGQQIQDQVDICSMSSYTLY